MDLYKTGELIMETTTTTTTTTTPTARQARRIVEIANSAAQRDSYGKLARLAETLPGMDYEVTRLWDSYNEMDADVDHRIEMAIDAGVTPEMMDMIPDADPECAA